MANAQNPIDVRLDQLSDEELDALLAHHTQSAQELAKLSPEEVDYLFQPYTAQGGNVEQAPVVAQPAPELSTGQMLAGGARELAGGALFEFADEAEAAARAPFSSEDYSTILRNIRQNRAQFSEAYPAAALGLNVAGGVGSMFVPGANVLGRAAQGATGISKIASPFGRVAASGALAGGVAGVGSGEDMGQRLLYGVEGAGLGAGLGAGFYGGAKGAKFLGDVVKAQRGQMGPDEVAQFAADLVNRRMADTGTSPDAMRDMAELAARNGVPFNLGTANPELARLTETVIQTPGGAQGQLAQQLFEQQVGAPARVQQRIQQSIPTPDYFASEEKIIKTLRDNATAAYGVVNDVEIRDPVIMDILGAPDIKNAYADALANVEREKVAAKLRGEDPEQYSLRQVFEPILDAEGSLVGLGDVPTTIPDIKTLNQIKIALDRRIDGLYSTGKGGEATALKNLRNAFVDRLDDVGPPEYRAARQQYKGDIEIKEALEAGRDANKMRWQEVNKFTRKASPGELQAFRTGYVQRLMQGFEDTSRRRNFAKEIIDNASQRKKLQAVMEPGEFQVFEAAMRREAELFETISRATGGSQTAGRMAARADIDAQLASGNAEAAASLLMNPTPGNIAMKALRIASGMRNANVSRATYTQLARILRAGTPDEVEAALLQLEQAAPVQRAADAAMERGVTKAGAGAAMVVAPSPELEGETLPETNELRVPDIDGLSAMPSGGGPSAQSGGSFFEALRSVMPDMQAGLADGSIVSESGQVMEGADVAKALGLPLETYLQYLFPGG